MTTHPTKMKYLVKLFLTNVALILAVHCSVATAQSGGRLDLSFGSGAGKVEGIQVGGSDFDSSSVVLQPDGKIVAIGRCYASEENIYLLCAARLNADGSRDMSYGTAKGEVNVDFGTTAYPQSAILQSDGKIVVAGACYQNPAPPRSCFARFSASGWPDPTFRGPDGSTSGSFLLATGFASGAYGLALQLDGKLVVAGKCSASGNFCVLRLNTDGTMDTTFGAAATPGKRVIVFSGVTSAVASSVSLLPDGKILVAGTCVRQQGTGGRFCVTRLHSDGSVDIAFVARNSAGAGGGVITVVDDFHSLKALLVQADMKPVLVGQCLKLATCVIRLMPDGQLDTTFAGASAASAGEVVFQTDGGYQFFHAATLQPDQKILLFGPCSYGDSHPCLARLHPYGRFDASFFGRDGSVPGLSQFMMGGGLSATLSPPGVVIQPDGKILAVGTCDGYSTHQLCAARVLSGLTGGPQLKTMSEFRLPSPFDYYFVTSRDSEKALLDAAAGWHRTGKTFSVLVNKESGSSPITRFFFDQIALGKSRGSHFYTLSPQEVAAVQALNPTNQPAPGKPVNEGVDSYAYPPSASGICATGQVPVYRLFRGNARFPDDANHRFTTELFAYNNFIAAGWDGEGVKFCVPQ